MGTFFGFLLALILGSLSSQIVSGKYLSKPFWLLATLIRPTPSYIYASFLIVIVPLGPFAGVLALTIVTTSMLSKYIRETFDGINLKVVDNLQAIGLSKIQVFIYGILPQVSSEITS
jgi:phosphonate transport system permease protein